MTIAKPREPVRKAGFALHPSTAVPSVSSALPPAASDPAPRRRTLLGYLVIPRPKDLIKALLMPLTFGWAVLASGGAGGQTVLRAIVVLAALELLVYPARYQWNDVRGFAADQRHPGEADRGRLPGPLTMARPHVVASCVVAAARVAVTLLLALLPGLHLGGVLVGVVVGVFGVAIAYEAIRSAATGRTGEATASLRPLLVLLWITVGAGYVVRGMTGLALVLNLRERPALGVAAMVTLWAYGVAFVTSRWAVESLAFARLHGDRVSWVAEASHAREHLLGLTRWLPARVDQRDVTMPGDDTAACWAALRSRTAVLAPWNLALILAGAAAALTGRLMTGTATWREAALVAAAGGLVSLAAVVATRSRVFTVVLGAAVLLVALVAQGTPSPLSALLPWLAVMTAYVHFSAQSLRTMGRLGRNLRAWLSRVLTPVARLVVGRQTWEVLMRRGPARV
jgi:hypothetical protein